MIRTAVLEEVRPGRCLWGSDCDPARLLGLHWILSVPRRCLGVAVLGVAVLLLGVGCAPETLPSAPPVEVGQHHRIVPPQPTPTQSFLPIAPDRADLALEGRTAEPIPAEVTDEMSLGATQDAGEQRDMAQDGAPLVGAAPTRVSPPLSDPLAYTVQSGDTLLGIALEFGVPMAAIQLSNDLGSATTVWVGQDLTIPQEGVWAGASPFWSVYEVVGGDTLSEVAARFDLEMRALLAANGLSEGDLIAVGQPLVLPIEALVEVDAKRGLAAAPPSSLPPAMSEPVNITGSPVNITEPVTTTGPAEAAQVTVDEVAVPTVTPTVTPIPAAEERPSVAGPAPSAELSALADEIFQRINGQRAAYGLPPLAWNATLARAAQLHADDCYARGWCNHTGSDGSTYQQRIIRAGYNPVRWSECWAWYGTPEMAVAMWMDETPPNDPHRRTILSDYLTEVGVGVVPGNGHGYYFIADFGTPGG